MNASAKALALASKNRLLCASCKGEPLCMQTCLDCRGSGYKACTDWPWCDHSLEAHADQRILTSNPPTPLTPPTIIAMPCSCASHNIADVNCDKCGGLGRRAYLTNGIGGSYVYYCVSGPTQGCLCEREIAAGGHPNFPHITMIASCNCGIQQLNVLCEVEPAVVDNILRNMVLRPPRAPRAPRPYTA